MDQNEPVTTDLNALAQFLHLIGNPLRLEILFTLLDTPHCVCELSEGLNQRQPCNPQHLTLLRKAGLVHSRREGWNRYYFIPSQKVKDCLVYMHASWIAEDGVVPAFRLQT